MLQCFLNQLVGVQSTVNGQPSATIGYVYDGNGNRYSKTVNGQTRYYSYDTSGNIVSEYKRVILNGSEESQTLVRYVRDRAGQVIEMIQGNRTYFYLYDGQDHITALTDESGSVVQTYSYDEYGNITNQTGTIYNPIIYTNYYWDSEVSLYHLKTRYYDPSIGRFLTRDKKGNEDQYESAQSSNFYIYAKNNPINYYDPVGKAARKKWFQAVVEVREAADWPMNRLQITGTVTWKGKKVLDTWIDPTNTGPEAISRFYGTLYAFWHVDKYKKRYSAKKYFMHAAKFDSPWYANFTKTSFTNSICQSLYFKNGHNAKSTVRAKLDSKGKIWQWKDIKKWQIEKIVY